jgi:ABC-type branched-subunit amino acid transport system ATPase component
MLAVVELAKRYSSIPAVSDVSFTVEPGKVLGYLGPNGSGKSTTVKMLTGLLQPSQGHILYRGRDILSGLCLWDGGDRTHDAGVSSSFRPFLHGCFRCSLLPGIETTAASTF